MCGDVEASICLLGTDLRRGRLKTTAPSEIAIVPLATSDGAQGLVESLPTGYLIRMAEVVARHYLLNSMSW
jgi:hypothetical protein